MKLKPLNKKILIKQIPEAEKTKSGLYVPTLKEAVVLTKVFAISPQSELPEGTVNIGDEILISKSSQTKIKIDKFNLGLIHEEAILGIKKSPEDS